MLTYTSTLRLKTGFFLVRPQKPYFANSPNTNHRLRYAPASLRKATSRPTSDDVPSFSYTQVLNSNAGCECWLKRNPTQSENRLWHLRGAEGDHLTMCSEGRKLPQHKTRALAVLRKLKTLLGGLRGECNGGRGGAQPLAGPLCPTPGRRPKLPRRRNPVPEGQQCYK